MCSGEKLFFQMDEIPVRNKEIYQGTLSIVNTKGKSGFTHERVKQKGLLSVSMSCHFTSESQRA